MENPFKKVINDWLDQGGEVNNKYVSVFSRYTVKYKYVQYISFQLWELIEPVDSLHPTQAAQPLIARALWDQLEREMPHVLGPVNPRNAEIRELFGDQGGH